MNEIAHRVSVFLTRYHQWLETGLNTLSTLGTNLQGDGLEALVTFQELRDRESEQLLSEYAVLLKEWKACTSVSDEDAAHIRMLATQVDTIRQQLQDAYAGSSARVALAQDACEEELQLLRKGKNTIRDYAPPTLDSDFFDRSV